MKYINADEFISYIDAGHYRNPCERVFSENDVVDMIKKFKGKDIMTGAWKDNFPDGYKCSECGASVKSAVISNYSWNIVGKMKYCPNCGADMRKKGKTE